MHYTDSLKKNVLRRTSVKINMEKDGPYSISDESVTDGNSDTDDTGVTNETGSQVGFEHG